MSYFSFSPVYTINEGLYDVNIYDNIEPTPHYNQLPYTNESDLTEDDQPLALSNGMPSETSYLTSFYDPMFGSLPSMCGYLHKELEMPTDSLLNTSSDHLNYTTS